LSESIRAEPVGYPGNDSVFPAGWIQERPRVRRQQRAKNDQLEVQAMAEMNQGASQTNNRTSNWYDYLDGMWSGSVFPPD
jgi:hypothetical protein